MVKQKLQGHISLFKRRDVCLSALHLYIVRNCMNNFETLLAYLQSSDVLYAFFFSFFFAETLRPLDICKEKQPRTQFYFRIKRHAGFHSFRS